MSTTFGIVIRDGELLDFESNQRIEEDDNTDIIEVWFRGNFGGSTWTNPLAKFLPPETKVYSIDNTPQGIYTIGDILENYEKTH